eukprot:SAG11_NODE_208_length_12354_cov_19.490167_8_plen_144_part_00
MFTQPLMYKTIAQHKPSKQLYAEKLIGEGSLTPEQIAVRSHCARTDRGAVCRQQTNLTKLTAARLGAGPMRCGTQETEAQILSRYEAAFTNAPSYNDKPKDWLESRWSGFKKRSQTATQTTTVRPPPPPAAAARRRPPLGREP